MKFHGKFFFWAYWPVFARRMLLTLAMISMPLAMAACGSGKSSLATSKTILTTSSTKTSTITSLTTSVPAGWPLQLVGAQFYSMAEDQFRDGISHHKNTYSDASGTWTGLHLWRLVGWVDDGIRHGTGAFNDAMANTGYRVKVSGSNGNYAIFDSAAVKHNDTILLANELNGEPLPAADPVNSTQLWSPLRLVGSGVRIDQKIGAVVKIELLNLPTSAPTTTIWGGEVEAIEFQGTKLTPIIQQGDNALGGTQFMDRNTYRLLIDGLVDRPLTLSYADLQAYPQESWLMDLNCVEGWNFTAKWTGPRLNSIFNDAKIHSEAKIAIFHTADVPSGYTALDLDYIRDNDIIIALKLNDVTLPQEKGFPFQVVAKSKYGYKWAKWVTRIELSSNTGFLGYWELRGFSNSGEINAPGYR